MVLLGGANSSGDIAAIVSLSFDETTLPPLEEFAEAGALAFASVDLGRGGMPRVLP